MGISSGGHAQFRSPLPIKIFYPRGREVFRVFERSQKRSIFASRSTFQQVSLLPCV